jgi:hypothetical protein
MPPSGLLEYLAAQNRAPESGGLLDPALYGKAPASPAWQQAARSFGNFTDNYLGRPVADATAMTLGLPGDAYLAATKLVSLPLGLNPEEVDLGYGRHVLPTFGDFQRLLAPLFQDTPAPSGPIGRVAQATLTGLASMPMGDEAPSLLTLLREGASGALPQAANEATDNTGVRLAAGLLPMLLGSTKKVRTLPGIGEVGPAGFRSFRMDGGPMGETRAFLNPTEAQLVYMAERAKYRTIRWGRDKDGNVYVWPANDLTHAGADAELGLDHQFIETGEQSLYENGKDWFRGGD